MGSSRRAYDAMRFAAETAMLSYLNERNKTPGAVYLDSR